MVCREIGFSFPQPHSLILDGLPETSKLMKNYPELKCYRDISFIWKYFLNPDRKAFPNYIDGSSGSSGSEVAPRSRMLGTSSVLAQY